MEIDIDKKFYNNYLNGEKEAFEYLYSKYKSRIEYFIFNIIKDHQKAEDLSQETFIYVMQNKMKENCTFKYYIYLVAKSKTYNYINVTKRRNEIDEQFIINENEKISEDILEVITREENKKDLLESIEDLDDRYKNAIYLVNIEGLSYEETAQILGESLQNTKNLIHRGKKQLRKLLLKKGFDEMNKVSKIMVILLISVVTLSGIVFAKDIEKFVREIFNFGLGKGIDSAAENGYIAEPEMEKVESQTKVENSEMDLGTVVDYINTSVTIDSFLMDDYNLSVEFNFEFEEKIKEIFNFNKLDNIIINDLMVLDEEKRLVYVSNYIGEETFNEFCKEHELNFTYKNFNEEYMNNGLNNFPKNVSADSNKIKLIYNMYASGYPKSKELDFYFKKITIMNEEKLENITLTGKWNIHVDVPENMFNRESISYKVINCSNKEFNITTAFATDTGFEIGIIIDNMEKPQYYLEIVNEEIQKEIAEGKITKSEINERRNVLLQTPKYQDLISQYYPIEDNSNNVIDINATSYIENESGQKFLKSLSPSRKQDCNFIYGNKFSYYETFELTKYEITDRLKVQIIFKGEPVIIELEKN